tara:strand:- start:309 stop:431 length:123 start_codon:yes stop_codon:yes gene_type:complete
MGGWQGRKKDVPDSTKRSFGPKHLKVALKNEKMPTMQSDV